MAPTDTPGAVLPAGHHSEPELFDWRRPSKFGREHVRALANAHDVFARRMSTSLGGMLRGLVQLEPVGIDQMTYDDYIRSLPNPNICALIGLSPLPGAVVLEMNVGFALQMVDRLLGGRGLPVDIRRPTDLETPLVRDIAATAVRCLSEAVQPTLDVRPQLSDIETNPQVVQVTAPSDMVLLLSFRLTIAQGEHTEGLVTLCYPATTLAPLLDRLSTTAAAGHELHDGEDAREDLSERIAAYLDDVTVPVTVRLTDSQVRARDLLALGVGDVLRLDHRVGQPVVAHVGQTPVLTGHVGRRGRRLGLQVLRKIPPLDDPFAPAPPAGTTSTTEQE